MKPLLTACLSLAIALPAAAAPQTELAQLRNINPAMMLEQIQTVATSLPSGVTITVDDPHNALAITGEPAAVETAKKLVMALDKPVRQVEVEAFFATMAPREADAFGLKAAPDDAGQEIPVASTNPRLKVSTWLKGAGSTFDIGTAGANPLKIMDALATAKRAKMLAAPRCTAILGRQFALSSTTSSPVGHFPAVGVLTDSPDSQAPAPDASVAGKPQSDIVYLNKSFGIDGTLTGNEDGTLSLVLNPFTSSSLHTVNGNIQLPQSQLITRIDHLEDGDTVILGDGLTRQTGVMSQSTVTQDDAHFYPQRPEAENETLVIFLTVRILRRIEAPVPGT